MPLNPLAMASFFATRQTRYGSCGVGWKVPAPMRRGSGWDRCRLFYRTSTDHGRTWSDDRPMLDETLWCVPRNPPIALPDGALLLPVEGLLDEVEGSHFLLLRKGTDGWQRAGFTSGGSQPALVSAAMAHCWRYCVMPGISRKSSRAIAGRRGARRCRRRPRIPTRGSR